MNTRQIIKITVDAAMTLILLLLMTYELIGQAAHEWLGIGIFVLFVLHHVLNSGWSRHVRTGRYTALRILQTALVVLVLLSMAGSMVSGVILSRHVLSFLEIDAGLSFARKLHMVSAYWGLVLMSLHLGFHWKMMMGMAKKLVKTPSPRRTWFLRGVVLLMIGYGIYAFLKRDIGRYMFLVNQFAFFDFEEPLIWFLLDYAACMGMFVAAGHYLSGLLRKRNVRKPT